MLAIPKAMFAYANPPDDPESEDDEQDEVLSYDHCFSFCFHFLV